MAADDYDYEDLDAAFSAGACAAYDDLGIIEPPWTCAGYTEKEREAWKRGLKAGYQHVAALIERDKRNGSWP